MDFFNKITNIASDTYKKTSEKTSKLAKETKLRMKMNENKSKIDDIYEEIGKIVYQKHVREEDISIKEDLYSYCEEIDKIAKKIEQYQDEILAMKQKKVCENCYTEIEINSKYCSNCGAEQPKQENEESKKIEAEAKEDVEEKRENIKEAEKMEEQQEDNKE